MYNSNGEIYLTPQEAAKKHKIPLPTIYYWVQSERVDLLDLKEACKVLPFGPEDLKSQCYIREQSLLPAIEQLKGAKNIKKGAHTK